MGEHRKTLAEEVADDAELLRRRFIHHTRPKGPMTLEQAGELCRRMEGDDDPQASGG